MAWRMALACGIVAAAAGCVHLPKPLFFTLDAGDALGEGAGAQALEPGRRIEVGRIAITDKLVRRDILIRMNDTEVEYYHEARWVAGLSDLAAEKLRTELEAPPQPGAETLVLDGTLLAFEQVDHEDGRVSAHIRLDASLRREGTSRYEPLWEKRYDHWAEAPADGPFPHVIVDALSEGLEAVAEAIARDANALSLPEG